MDNLDIKAIKKQIPANVFDCWNKEILKNLKFKEEKLFSKIFFKDIKKSLIKLGFTENQILKNNYLDISKLLEYKGWIVNAEKDFIEFTN